MNNINDISNKNKRSFTEILFILLCICVVSISTFYGYTYAQYEYKTPIRWQVSWVQTWEKTNTWKSNVTRTTTWTRGNKQQNSNNVKSDSTWTQSLEWLPTTITDIVWTYKKVNAVVNNTWITDSIIWSCSIARNQSKCINMMLGISKAESSIFRNCYNYNCFGIKPSGNIQSYTSYDESIKDWVRRYNLYRYNNDNAEEMLRRSHYCKGECENIWSNWRRSVDSFIWYIQ